MELSLNPQYIYGRKDSHLGPSLKRLEMVKRMLNAKEWLDVFPALENVVRFNILIFLNNEGPNSFTKIKENRKLSPGNCTYHLNKLMKAGLVTNSYRTPSEDTREYSDYEITEKGHNILEILLG